MRAFTPTRTYDSDYKSRHILKDQWYSARGEDRKYEYSTIGGRPRDIVKTIELPDYEDIAETKDKYHETIEKLQIKNKMRHWLSYTKEWIHEGIIKKLIKLDLDNLTEITRLLSKYGYNLVFVKEDEHTQSRNSLVPYEYDRICKYYYNERHKTIDMQELLSLELKQNLIGKLYGKYYYSIKGKPLFDPDEEYRKVFEEKLQQRRDIEKYYTLEGFGPEVRFYTYFRVNRMAEDPMLKIRYNSGEAFHGSEWTPKLPTDAQIIMWMF